MTGNNEEIKKETNGNTKRNGDSAEHRVHPVLADPIAALAILPLIVWEVGKPCAGRTAAVADPTLRIGFILASLGNAKRLRRFSSDSEFCQFSEQ